MIMLRIDGQTKDDDEEAQKVTFGIRQSAFSKIDSRQYEPENDSILKKSAILIVPLILMFGLYVILNGHISPGGGFSGGAILGAGLILFLSAFGFQTAEKVLNAKTVKIITLVALLVYCLAKSYSFFTGANHLESGIPLGTPGAILSSGLILVLNICVGMVVACTMYSFYALVRRGRI
jgi:multicomponent Na+:H+ antiporter subunit B